MKYYLVGIKGTGMSALASMLYDCGNDIIGSDVLSNFFNCISNSGKSLFIVCNLTYFLFELIIPELLQD